MLADSRCVVSGNTTSIESSPGMFVVVDVVVDRVDTLEEDFEAEHFGRLSPDGRWTFALAGASAFYATLEGDPVASELRIWQTAAHGGQPQQLSAARVFSVALSPDGRRLAWITNTSKLWVIDLGDGSPRQLASGVDPRSGAASWPKWSPAASRIAFSRSPVTPSVDPTEPGWSIWIIRSDGSGERIILDRPDGSPRSDAFDIDW
jgi:Tol biopolymer transport system component